MWAFSFFFVTKMGHFVSIWDHINVYVRYCYGYMYVCTTFSKFIPLSFYSDNQTNTNAIANYEFVLQFTLTFSTKY